MISVGRILSIAIVTASVSTGAASAQTMSTDEMVEAFKIQQAIRGVPPVSGVTRGLSITYGEETEVAPALQSPQVVIAPTAPVTIPPGTTQYSDVIAGSGTAIATTPVVDSSLPAPLLPYAPQTQPVPTPVALETYVPVPENARVDLDIFFEWNSASLKPQAIGQLSSLCAAIEQMLGGNVFKIIGHTDKSGSDAYNLYLSQARAREVKRHLVEECAIPASALVATGEGEQQADPNAPQRNPVERRVEVQLAS